MQCLEAQRMLDPSSLPCHLQPLLQGFQSRAGYVQPRLLPPQMQTWTSKRCRVHASRMPGLELRDFLFTALVQGCGQVAIWYHQIH